MLKVNMNEQSNSEDSEHLSTSVDVKSDTAVHDDNVIHPSGGETTSAREEQAPITQSIPVAPGKIFGNPSPQIPSASEKPTVSSTLSTEPTLIGTTMGANTKQPVDWSKYLRMLGTAFLVVVVLGVGWLYEVSVSTQSNFATYKITQNNPAYTVMYFPRASSTVKNGNTLITYKDSNSDKTVFSIWFIKSALSLGNNPKFTYSLSGHKEVGACNYNTGLCVSYVGDGSRYLQIGIESTGKLKIVDIKAIFSSIKILS
jgi:hypothetical protein